MDSSFHINGVEYKLSCDPRTSLSDFIRDHAGLKGTKVMCREGGCGACVVTVTSVHPVSGKQVTKAVNSCLCPVGSIIGSHITTVEGVGNQHSGFHPIQKSIADHNGSQCGYCTPGMVMNMYSLLCNKPSPSPVETEKSFDGNLCRCTGYRGILSGVKDVLCQNGPYNMDIEDLHKFKCPKNELSTNDFYNWVFPKDVKEVFGIIDRNPGKFVKLLFGNTASGFYKTKLNADFIVDLRSIAELHKIEITDTKIELGANVTIQDMIFELENLGEGQQQFYYLKHSLVPMLYKLGSTPIRNASSWAGNLVLRHKYHSFVSDLFTPLEALQAKITVVSKYGTQVYTPCEFLNADINNKVLVNLSLPALNPTTERFQTFKVMHRAANALCIMNAGLYVELKEPNGSLVKIVQGRFVYGGVGSMIHSKNAEEVVENKEVSKELLKECLEMLENDTQLQLNQYQCMAARNILYQFLKNACDPNVTTEQFYENTMDKEIESETTYDYEKKTEKYPECQPLPKLDSLIQCSGEAQYVSDRPHVEQELQACVVMSTQAKAKIAHIDIAKAESLSGVVKVITAKDIQGKNKLDFDMSGGSDTPVLAEQEIFYAGQPVAVVIANNLDTAKSGAKAVVITYTNIETPILDIEEAVLKQYYHKGTPINKLVRQRGGELSKVLDQADHVISGQVKLGTQYHFYMEKQHCLVVPYDDSLDIWLTSQGPAVNQTTISTVTGIPMSSINTHVLRIGGGFGGRVIYSALLGAMTATAAQIVKRPVRMSFDLEECMKIQGKRMPFLARYKVGCTSEGKIQAMDLDYFHDCGGQQHAEADFIANEVLMNTETVYHIPNLHFRGHLMKTDKPPTTPVRGPTTVPSGFIMESIMEKMSFVLKQDPVILKQKNLIKDGDPYLRDGIFSAVTISDLYTDIITSSKVDTWKHEVEQFNKVNYFRKRGLSIVPVRNPISYCGTGVSNTAYLTAYVHDGTVSITHGGVEMGQGLNTKAIQTAARTLGIDHKLIKNHPTASLTSANNTHTGGSTGSDCVGRSILECCKELNERLEPVRKRFPGASWIEILQQANILGIDLAVSKKYVRIQPEAYSTYGVCALEAEVNMLTGEHQVNRVDTIFDVGESINPIIDIGQIEGALSMSLGYYRFEKEKYDPKTGVLLTNGTWDYKPPTALDIPRKMNVKLMKGNVNKHGMMSYKGIGEPPINCGPAVMFAVQKAVQSFRESKQQTEYIQLEQPLTPEEVLTKSDVTIEDLLKQ